MKLMVVKEGKWLYWPPEIAAGRDKLRGSSGYVVDVEAPLEVDWIAGQEYKLGPAPKGAKATRIEHVNALRRLKQLETPPKKTPVTVKAAQLGIELPDDRDAE